MARKKKKKSDAVPPGFKLLHTLRGHKSVIWEIAWSPDGQTFASGSNDKTIRLWDPASGKLRRKLSGHEHIVRSVSWSPDGRILASGSNDKTVRLWNLTTGKLEQTLRGHLLTVNSVSWSPDGRMLASGSDDGTIRLWNSDSGELRQTLKAPPTWHVSWSPDSRTLASGSDDGTIRLWNTTDRQSMSVLEGHRYSITALRFSATGQLLASKSWDGTVRLWRADTGEPLAILDEPSDLFGVPKIIFHPTEPILATLGEKDRVIRIWRLDYDVILGGEFAPESVRYTTAKIVLVGDSGVGKTGLGWRLAHDAFKEHSSTHGQQFWVIDELGTTRTDGTECEAVLWDLAGQPDYRLVHSLFLDDVDLALVLFDPTKRQEPLSGVDFWLNQLKQRDQRLCRCLLIGARSDTGTATLTDAELDAYCQKQGIHGGYIATSAKEGDGLPELMTQLKAQIPWDEMTATVTTTTFKRIKEFVLSLKEDKEHAEVLISPEDLRERLQSLDAEWNFTDAEMMTAVGHLQNHGYVAILRGSQGHVSILLTPDLLINLASSFVLEARRNPLGLGVLEENRLLRGEYKFKELMGLNKDERDILLDAATVLFLKRNICFRETFNEQTFLVFPSLINEKRPATDALESIEDASYRVSGAVENVYASLVVLLGYTNTFTRHNQWQNQAQYALGKGEICGFEQSDYRDGEIELVLYYARNTPGSVQLLFRGLFERFLLRRELEIVRFQPVICHNDECGERLERNVVMAQLDKGRDFSFCPNCGERLSLPAQEALTELPPAQEEQVAAEQIVVQRRTAFETALVRVKALLRDRAEAEKRPTCFISYAWGVPEHERWVIQLARDMRNASIDILLDRWHNPPGGDIDRYTDKIESSEFVVVVGTPLLKEKYKSATSDPVVASELELINFKLRKRKRYGRKVIPLLLAGEPDTALTPKLEKLVGVDFRDEDYYFVNLFDLIWRLYDLPFDHRLLEDLRRSMSPPQR